MRPPRTRRRFRAPLGIVATLVCAALVVGYATGQASDTAGAPSLSAHQNISDNLRRTDLSGLGTAPVGGRWAIMPRLAASVTQRGAALKVAPGSTVRATVLGVRSANEMLRAVFEVPTTSLQGNGLYVGLELRRQAAGQVYRALINFRPGHRMVLRIVKRVNGVSTVIARSAPMVTPAAGTLVALEAAVTGTVPTQLQLRWWRSGAQRPAWQLSATDRTPGALADAGRFGITAISTPKSQPATVNLDEVQGWTVPTAGTGSSTVRAGGSAAGTSAAPTTPAAAPAPVKASSGQHSSTGATTPPAATTTPNAPPAGNTAGTAGNTSPSAAGSLAPGRSAYSVPGGAVFVSPSGSTSGTGTSARPVRTIAQAAKIARSGGTIVLRAGVYHESVTLPANKSLTLQSYPHEAVWLDGSSSVSGWSRSGSGWVHSNWTARFDHSPDYVTSGAITSRNPMAAYPDQVWINGAAQTQVGSLSKLGAGTFYVDTANKRLYVGSNPGAGVRASDLQVAVYMSGANSVIRGIGVRNYATSVSQKGTIRMRGAGSSLQNVIVLNSATCGLDLTSTNLRVDHVSVINAGLLGAHGSMSDGLQFTNSVLKGNNSQHFLYKPVAGGIKLGSSRNVRFAGNLVSSNDGIGVWFDVSSMNITIASNTITGNTLRGIQTEISQGAIMVDNRVTGNGQAGIFVLDTGGVKIWNNTLSGNGFRDITILQDSRTPQNYHMGWDKHTNSANPSIPWVTRNVQISDNLLQSAGTQYEMSVYDASQKRSASGMGVAVDGNVYARSSSKGHKEIGWAVPHKGIPGYATPAAFTKATGQGKHNRDYAAGTLSAQTAATQGDPLPMPADVARAAGRASGTKHVGAF